MLRITFKIEQLKNKVKLTIDKTNGAEIHISYHGTERRRAEIQLCQEKVKMLNQTNEKKQTSLKMSRGNAISGKEMTLTSTTIYVKCLVFS